MPSKSPSEVGSLLAWWDSTAGVASTTWTDTVGSKVLTASSAGAFPTTVVRGTKTYLRFGVGKRVSTTVADASYTPVFSGNCTIVMFGRVQDGEHIVSTTKVSDYNVFTHESALVLSRDRDTTQDIYVAHIDGSASISQTLPSGDRLEIPGRLSLFGLRKTGSSLEALVNTTKSAALAITNVTDADGLVVGDRGAVFAGTMDVEHLVVFSAAVSDQDMADMLRWYRPSKSPIHAGATVWLDPTQNVTTTTWTDRISGVVFTKSAGANLAAVTVANRPMVRLDNIFLDSPADVADIASHFCTSTTFVFGANRTSYPSTYAVHGTSLTGGQIRGIWSGGSPNVNSVYEQQFGIFVHYIQYWSGTIDYGVPHYRSVSRFSGETGFGSFDGSVISTAIVGNTTSTAHWLRINSGPAGSDLSDTDYGGIVYFPAGLRQYEIAEINDFMLDQELYANEIDGVATVSNPSLRATMSLASTVNGVATVTPPTLSLATTLLSPNAINGYANVPQASLAIARSLSPNAINGVASVPSANLTVTSMLLIPNAINGVATLPPPEISITPVILGGTINGVATVTPPSISLAFVLVPTAILGRATVAANLTPVVQVLAPPPVAPAGISVPFTAPSFLGRGLLTPFRRDGKGDFLNASDEDNIRACVQQVLGTECAMNNGATSGELPWRPEFGSVLYRLRHRGNDQALQLLARQFVIDAIRRWEPRVSVTDVEIIKKKIDTGNVGGEDALFIRVRYDIIQANVPGNAVAIPGVMQDVRV